METNMKRRLALMQHLGEEFFIVMADDTEESAKVYEGNEEVAREAFRADIEGTEEPEIESNFEIFCSNNYAEVEELEEDDNGDYLVLTDDEADEKWEESLDSYISEIIEPEIEKMELGDLSYYIKFDEESWKSDAKMDGRGHRLSGYDGNENEEEIEGEIFYIYRLN